jgi:hypothetical protein
LPGGEDVGGAVAVHLSALRQKGEISGAACAEAARSWVVVIAVCQHGFQVPLDRAHGLPGTSNPGQVAARWAGLPATSPATWRS